MNGYEAAALFLGIGVGFLLVLAGVGLMFWLFGKAR